MSLIYKGQTIAGAGGSGGSSEEIYSTEETRIGTWIDGKPLYRKVFSFPEGVTFDSSLTSSMVVANPTALDALGMDRICAWHGMIYNQGLTNRLPWTTFGLVGGSTSPVNSLSHYYISYSPRSGLLLNRTSSFSAETSFDYLYVSLEYTKTTDEATS